MRSNSKIYWINSIFIEKKYYLNNKVKKKHLHYVPHHSWYIKLS